MKGGRESFSTLDFTKQFSVVGHFLEGNLEPLGITLGMKLEVGFQGVDTHIFPRFHLFTVDLWNLVALPYENVVKLVFGESLPNGSLIDKGVDFVHIAVHSHLFHQATRSGLQRGFSVAGMAAAGVGP